MKHFIGAFQESRRVHPCDRCGNHAEVRQGRIAPANAWITKTNTPEAVGLGDLLQFRPWISDGNKLLAHFRSTGSLLSAVKEILFENVGLEGAAGLAGHDEQSAGELEFTF